MLRNKVLIAFTGAAGITLTGCGTLHGSQSSQQMDAKEGAAKVERSTFAGMESSMSARERAGRGGDEILLPSGAKPGECYARVWVPAQYKTTSEQVLVKDESERVEIEPAQYEWVEETVVTKEGSTRLEAVPAEYATERETIKVKDASRLWRTGPNLIDPLASKELLAMAKSSGIDLDAAAPGICFHEHYRPARYETETKPVLVSEASEEISVNAPQYRMVEKRVLVSEASTRLEEVPAVYEWVEEQVLDKPAHTIWKKGTGPIQRIDEATGEIMCLVEVPASYKTVKRRVLKHPATTRTVEVPAEYKTVKVRELVEAGSEAKTEVPARYQDIQMTRKVADASFVWHEIHNMEEPKQTRTGLRICLTEEPAQFKTVSRRVVKRPASVREVEVPAEFKTVKVRKLVAEPREKRIKIPAEYRTVERQELLAEGNMEWRSILCETNMTRSRISDIQYALAEAGYDPGPIDGVAGAQTMAAVNAFQREKGLPVDEYLNIETVKALNVSPR